MYDLFWAIGVTTCILCAIGLVVWIIWAIYDKVTDIKATIESAERVIRNYESEKTVTELKLQQFDTHLRDLRLEVQRRAK
jgi:hypothetical protein